MPNTNPQAISFANQKGRPNADVILSAIETAREFDADYTALSGDTLFPNDAELIEDGSAADGRPRVQNQEMRAMRNLCQSLLTWAATGNPTNETRLRRMAVNGQAKF